MNDYPKMGLDELKSHAAKMKIPGFQNMKKDTLLSRVNEWVSENGDPVSLVIEKSGQGDGPVSTTEALASFIQPAKKLPARPDIEFDVFQVEEDFIFSNRGVTTKYSKGDILNSRHHNTDALAMMGAKFKKIGKG